MNVETYIPSEAELELMADASKMNHAASLVYAQYLANMLARVRRLADSFDAIGKQQDAEGGQGGDAAHELARRIREAASPLPSTSTAQPVVSSADLKVMRRNRKRGRYGRPDSE